MAIVSLISIVFTMGVKNFGNQFLRIKLRYSLCQESVTPDTRANCGTRGGFPWHVEKFDTLLMCEYLKN